MLRRFGIFVAAPVASVYYPKHSQKQIVSPAEVSNEIVIIINIIFRLRIQNELTETNLWILLYIFISCTSLSYFTEPPFFFMKIFCDPISVFSCPSPYLEDNDPPHYQRWWRSKVESTEANLHPSSYIITIFCSYGRTAPQTKIEHVLYDISKLSILISKINESILNQIVWESQNGINILQFKCQAMCELLIKAKFLPVSFLSMIQEPLCQLKFLCRF